MKKTPQKKMSKKELEAMPLHSDADVKRYIGAVTESFDEKFDVVIEGVNGLSERMDRMDQRFDVVDKKLDSHSEMIGRLLLDMEEVKSGMRQKIDRAEFTKLEKRMVALETYVFTGKANIKK